MFIDRRWALWGIVQAGQSTIDFDYIGYALGRLSMYWKDREAYKNRAAE